MLNKIKYYVLAKFNLTSLYALKDSGLAKLGWFRSYDEVRPVDFQGNPIPWMTYPFICFIERRLKTISPSILEFGSGASTLWWAKYGNSVLAIEHDEAWFNKVRTNLPSNASIQLVKLNADDYESFPTRLGKSFEIIVVDGRRRNECMKEALKYISPNGIIILDNSDRERYQEGINFLFSQGFKSIDFIGMTPMGIDLSETSLFYRASNILGI